MGQETEQELTVQFSRSDDLTAQELHLFDGGGLFLPPPEPPPEPFQELRLHVVPPLGLPGELRVRVVQVQEGDHVALVPVEPEAANRTLAPMFDTARRHMDNDGEPPVVYWGSPRSRAAARGADDDDEPGTLHDRIRAMSTAEKRKLALRGDRAARMILARDTDKNLHTFVIQNPGITLDELRFIAGHRQTNPETLKLIASKREHIQHLSVVSALVSNPKTPTPLAVRLLDRLDWKEVRRLAHSGNTPPAVATAARRKIVK